MGLQFSWPMVVALVVVVAGAVGAYALGGVELAAVLGGLAGGMLLPQPARKAAGQ